MRNKKENPEMSFENVTVENSFIKDVVINNRGENYTLPNVLSSFLADSKFKPFLASPEDLLSCELNEKPCLALRSIDLIHVRLVVNCTNLGAAKELYDKVFIERADKNARLVLKRENQTFVVGTRNQFESIGKLLPEKAQDGFILDFKINPTRAILKKRLIKGFKNNYDFPLLSPSGQKKDNHFHPSYLKLPHDFNFVDEMNTVLSEIESDFETVTFFFHQFSPVTLEIYPILSHIELYSDYLTVDPVSTFFQLGWQMESLLRTTWDAKEQTAAFKGYNNNNKFLSQYAWSGSENRTPEECYLALTGFPSKRSKDKSSFVRFERRLFPNRKFYKPGREIIIPEPKPLSAVLALSPQWLLVRLIEMSLPEHSRFQVMDVLNRGEARLTKKDYRLLKRVLKNRDLGMYFSLKTSNTKKKSTKKNKGTKVSGSYMALRVNSHVYYCYALMSIFEGLTSGYYKDLELRSLLSNNSKAAEYLRRKLKRKLPKKT